VRTVVIALVLLASAGASANPDPEPRTHVETERPRLLCVPPQPPERCITLPPGHFVDTGTWSAIDTELRAARDRVTKLEAENKSLRASADSWQPGWKLMALTLLAGAAGGWYVHARL
jgi:hypothetical protein